MPAVPVTDLTIHPRESDLIVGTYGRGIWITNIAVLREINDAVLNKDVHLFAVQPRSRRSEGAVGNYRLLGDRILVTPNEPNGLALLYYFRGQPSEKVTIMISGKEGAPLRTLEGASKAGLNRTTIPLGGFNLQPPSDGEGRPGPAGQLRDIPPGEYDVTLKVGERKFTQKAQVLP